MIFDMIKNHLEINWAKQHPNAPYHKLQLSINAPLSQRSSQFPLLYWRSPNGKKEFWALGKLASFDTLPTQLMNDNLTILSVWPFAQQDLQDGHWQAFAEYKYYLPQIIISDQSLEINYPRTLLDNGQLQNQFLTSLRHLLTPRDIRPLPRFTHQLDLPSQETWAKHIDTITSLLENNEIQKAVLARKKIYHSSHAIDPRAILLTLPECHSNAYLFYLQVDTHQAFISVSPERLFGLQNGTITCDALAGTRARGTDSAHEKQLEQELNTSRKESIEHQLVIEDIASKLSQICPHPQLATSRKLLKLKKVMHLKSSLAGQIRSEISIEQILSILHPTSAVGGMPWARVHELIKEFEPFARGLYAAPLGYIMRDDSEFIVGIRSLLINNNELHLFGGAGIVKGSNGEREWQEIESKMSNFHSII